MIEHYSRTAFYLTCLTACTHAAAPATTQSLERRMIDLAPVISVDDPQTQSFDVQMVVKMGGGKQMMVRALHDRDGGTAMYVSDPRDGTPLIIIANGRLIAYDPIDGVLRMSDNATGSLNMRQEGKEFKLNFGFNANERGKPPKPWAIKVDLASIMKRGDDGTAVENLGGAKYGLRQRRTETSVLYAAIDPARPCPYLRLEIVDDQGEGVTLDPITRNEPIDPAAFAPPPRDVLEKRIAVKEWPGDGVLAQAKGLQAMMLIILARAAADDPPWQAQLDRNWATRVDWAKVKNNDAKFAPVLRELFPLATAAPSGSGTSATKPAADSNGLRANRAQ